MSVGRHFGLQQRYALLAANFALNAQAQARSLSLLQRRRALQVGQRKGTLAVAAVHGAQQGE